MDGLAIYEVDVVVAINLISSLLFLLVDYRTVPYLPLTMQLVTHPLP